MTDIKLKTVLCMLLAFLAVFSGVSCSGGDKSTSTTTTTSTNEQGNEEGEEVLKEYTSSNWMSAIEDERSLGSIAMPGTHDSGATKEPLAGTAKCQGLTIAEQLEVGVRYFDIRLRRENGKLNVYHGYVDQELSFDEVLDSCYTFLENNPSEALIMCIKEEYDALGSNSGFDVMVKEHIDANENKWYIGSDVPSLGQVRGKIVLMRRYGTSGTCGFDASSGWSDNTTFTLRSNGATLKCQDYYDDESAEKKWEEIEDFFSQMKPKKGIYYLNNTSGYVSGLFGIPSITSISDTVNPKLLETLTANDAPDIVGIIATDFMTDEIALAIYSLNFDN